MIRAVANVIAATTLLAAVGCSAPAKLKSPMPEPDTHAYRKCQADADCSHALNGCCDCANGGDDFAVAKSEIESFRARFECNEGCTEIGGDCARGSVACERGLCVYHAPKTF